MQKSDVPFSVYDSDGPSFASTPLSDALEDVRKSAGGSLTEIEASDLSKKPTNLLTIFDSGKRDPAALERAALQRRQFWDFFKLPRGRAPNDRFRVELNVHPV